MDVFNSYRILPIIATLFLVMMSCHAKKEMATDIRKPPVVYNPLPSRVVINFRLDKRTIRDTFNQAIAEIFKEDFNMPEYDVKINFYKTKDATVDIEGKSILVNIPVGILVEKNTFLVNMKARGVIELTFLTKFDLDSLWNFSSKTDLSYYKWLEKPVLNMAGLQIPIEPLSNVILSKVKSDIVESIDASIQENFTIKQTIHETMQVFKDPVQLDPGSGGYLNLTPTKTYLMPLKNSKLNTSGKIAIDLTTTFTTYPPQPKPGPIITPPLSWQETMDDTSTLRLVTHLKMMDLNEIARKNFEGKTFTSQGKSITLNNLFLNCDYETMRFVSDVSGSVQGTLIIRANPFYDDKTNAFTAKNIDISFKTKNKIHKAASWIAEGYIRKELEKVFHFPLESQLDEIQNDLNAQLEEINQTYNMDIQAKISKVTSEHFYMKPGEIEATIYTRVHLSAFIKDFKSIGK